MKKIVMLLFAMVIGAAGVANATLIGMSGFDIVNDDTHSTYWYSDLTYFSGLTMGNILTEINHLNATAYGGFTTWQLATSSEMTALFTYDEFEIHDAFNPSSNWIGYRVGTFTYRGRYDDGTDPANRAGVGELQVRERYWNGDTIITIPRHLIDNLAVDTSTQYSAWITTGVISEGPGPAPVPEPATMLLLGVGMIGLAGARKKYKR
jgi:hypothetical protein